MHGDRINEDIRFLKLRHAAVLERAGQAFDITGSAETARDAGTQLA